MKVFLKGRSRLNFVRISEFLVTTAEVISLCDGVFNGNDVSVVRCLFLAVRILGRNQMLFVLVCLRPGIDPSLVIFDVLSSFVMKIPSDNEMLEANVWKKDTQAPCEESKGSCISHSIEFHPLFIQFKLLKVCRIPEPLMLWSQISPHLTGVIFFFWLNYSQLFEAPPSPLNSGWRNESRMHWILELPNNGKCYYICKKAKKNRFLTCEKCQIIILGKREQKWQGHPR